jgi:hypothetical protein
MKRPTSAFYTMSPTGLFLIDIRCKRISLRPRQYRCLSAHQVKANNPHQLAGAHTQPAVTHSDFRLLLFNTQIQSNQSTYITKFTILPSIEQRRPFSLVQVSCPHRRPRLEYKRQEFKLSRAYEFELPCIRLYWPI